MGRGGLWAIVSTIFRLNDWWGEYCCFGWWLVLDLVDVARPHITLFRDMSANLFNGTIEEIAKLSQLQTLCVGVVLFRPTQHVPNHVSHRTLHARRDISVNEFTGDIATFSKLVELTSLCVGAGNMYLSCLCVQRTNRVRR